MNTFNNEIEQKWEQNQQQILEEEFVDTINFFCKFREPELEEERSNVNSRDYKGNDENSEQPNEDETGNYFEEIGRLTTRRKSISLCRHKLQGKTRGRPESWRQRLRPHQ
jgi:hypothetical protein